MTEAAASGLGWEQLLATALIGTDRRALPEAGSSTSDPTALLDAAAAAALSRDAGRRPRAAAPPRGRPAPPEPCGPAAERAAELLAELLAAGPVGLVDEWVARAAAAGLRAPEELLPALLDRRRPADMPVLGLRGQWLAAQRPQWRWAAVGPGAEAGGARPVAERWRTGTGDERRLLLTVVRAADPPAGRHLLAGTWDREPPGDRAAFVDCLATGLGADDEDFLDEVAHTDRAPQVRRAAGRLLAGRPASALAAEVGTLVSVTVADRPDPPRLEVQPPEPWPTALDTPPPAKRAARSWRIEQLAGIAPLLSWVRASGGLGPAPLVELARAGEHGDELLAGWAVAAGRQGTAEWARAVLLAAGLAPPKGAADDRAPASAAAVASVAPALLGLPPAEAAAWVAGAVGRHGLGPATVPLLDTLPGPWPADLTQVVLAAVSRQDPPFALLGRLGLRLDPRVVDTRSTLPQTAGLEALLDLLTIRLLLHEELR